MIFFWIGNKTFIEQKNWTSCSRWWTLWTMKQIQEDQELKEIETKKSATAVQFVHPQIQAQRNRVRKSKHFRYFLEVSFYYMFSWGLFVLPYVFLRSLFIIYFLTYQKKHFRCSKVLALSSKIKRMIYRKIIIKRMIYGKIIINFQELLKYIWMT